MLFWPLKLRLIDSYNFIFSYLHFFPLHFSSPSLRVLPYTCLLFSLVAALVSCIQQSLLIVCFQIRSGPVCCVFCFALSPPFTEGETGRQQKHLSRSKKAFSHYWSDGCTYKDGLNHCVNEWIILQQGSQTFLLVFGLFFFSGTWNGLLWYLFVCFLFTSLPYFCTVLPCSHHSHFLFVCFIMI